MLHNSLLHSLKGKFIDNIKDYSNFAIKEVSQTVDTICLVITYVHLPLCSMFVLFQKLILPNFLHRNQRHQIISVNLSIKSENYCHHDLTVRTCRNKLTFIRLHIYMHITYCTYACTLVHMYKIYKRMHIFHTGYKKI